MNIERLQKLEKLLENDPDDPFLIYAMATEWRAENPNKSIEFYNILLRDHEEYVGTYYHAADLYASLGDRQKAESIYKKGIDVARRINDTHALRELVSAYDEFQFEEDEDED